MRLFKHRNGSIQVIVVKSKDWDFIFSRSFLLKNYTRLSNRSVIPDLEEDSDDPRGSQFRKKLNEIVRILKRTVKTLSKVLGSSFESERLEKQILKLSNITTMKNDNQYVPLSILLTYDLMNEKITKSRKKLRHNVKCMSKFVLNKCGRRRRRRRRRRHRTKL